jgi:predicted secreted hydrolase
LDNGVQSLQRELNFPNDHRGHDSSVEWWFFFGRVGSEFFHFAEFSLKVGPIRERATHWSLHNKESRYFEELADDFNYLKYGVEYIPKGNSFSIDSKHFFLKMFPNSKPMIHEASPERNYYSIPSLMADGMLYAGQEEIKSDVWMDHEFTNFKKFSDWDWVGVKLDCGVYIMVHNSETDKRCSIQFNGMTDNPEFRLEGNELFVDSFGVHLHLDPIVEEKIWNPKFGIPYSEQPFEAISNGKKIGYGMREKTYKSERL